MIIGRSGSGKSTSLRNFEPGEVGVFNVVGKPMPFRKKLSVINGANYEQIQAVLVQNKFKRYVIDDANYLMSYELFAKVAITGYNKFTEIAVHFKSLLDTIIRATPTDCIVYLMMHTDETEQGIRAKTVGKMLDSVLCVEGLFSIVLRAKGEKGKYTFATQTDGFDTVKSPFGMFDTEIDNDLKMVDEKIREYWDLKEEVKEGKSK